MFHKLLPISNDLTKAYRGTRDVLAVARMLGHSRTETTQRYVQLDDGALIAAMNASAA